MKLPEIQNLKLNQIKEIFVSPQSVSSSAPLSDAASVATGSIPSLAVIVDSESRKLAGVITSIDIARILSAGQQIDPKEPVAHVMNRNVIYIVDDRTIDDAVNLMNQSSVNN